MRILLIFCIILLSPGVFAQEAGNSRRGTIKVKKPEDSTATSTITRDSVYEYADEMPDFKGGNKAFNKFLKRNLDLPERDLDSIPSARLVITFIVEKDGTLTNIEVAESVSPAIDNEVLRIVRLMPPWLPAMHQGKPVAMKIRMPVDFGNPDSSVQN